MKLVHTVNGESFDFFLNKGDYVDVDFYVSGKISAAQVVSLKTVGPEKVLVDLDVTVEYGTIKKTKVRIHGVDSHLCRLRDEAYLEELNKKNQKQRTAGVQEPIVLTQAFGPNEFPKLADDNDPEDDALSVHVLIDIDGTKKYFDTGWYNFTEKSWNNCNSFFTSQIQKNEFKWMYIP